MDLLLEGLANNSQIVKLACISAGCIRHSPRHVQVIVRPLVVGERVTLSGAVNVTGVVEQLDFLQTVIRTDTHIPYTLPNKVHASLGLF